MDIVSQPWKSPRQTWGRWGMHVGDRVGAYSVTGLTGMVGLSLNQCGRQNIFPSKNKVGGLPDSARTPKELRKSKYKNWLPAVVKCTFFMWITHDGVGWSSIFRTLLPT